MAQADPKQQRSLLAQILSGGGRGDPYVNEASGPFANSPRIYGRADPYPAKAKLDPQSTGSIPVPQDRPDRGGGGGGGGGGGPQIPIPLSRPGGPGGGTTTGQPPPLPGGPGGGTMTGQHWPPYPTIASDQTGFPTPPYPTVAEDQGWGLPQPTPPHSILQHYPQIASDTSGFPPFQPPLPPHSMTPPEARLGLGRPSPYPTARGPGMETAMFGQHRDYSGMRPKPQQQRHWWDFLTGG